MRILVVEDEKRMAALLKRGLTEEGHQVFVAHEGVEIDHPLGGDVGLRHRGQYRLPSGFAAE